jgi:hypothetical protein
MVNQDNTTQLTGCPRCCGYRPSRPSPVNLAPFVNPDEVARMFGAVDPSANEHTCPLCEERWVVERCSGSHTVQLGRLAPLPVTFEGTWRFSESAPQAEGESRSLRLLLAWAGAELEGELETQAWNDYVEDSLRTERRRITAKVEGLIATVQIHGDSPIGMCGWERFAIKPVARYDSADQPRVGLFVASDAERLLRNMPFRTWQLQARPGL